MIPILGVVIALGAAVAVGIMVPTQPRESVRPRGDSATTPAPPGILARRAELDLGDAHIDFGEVWPNEEVEAVVVVHNRSAFDVEILNLATTCACLVSEAAARTIPAGGSVEITQRLIVPDMQNTPMRFETNLRISDVPEPPRLFVSAFAREVVEAEPDYDEIGTLRGARLRSVDDQPITVITLPPFLRLVDPDAGPASTVDVEFGASGRGVDRFADARPRLVFRHPVHGEVSIDWQRPMTFPTRGLPPMSPRPASVNITVAQAVAGHEFDVLLDGPTARELDRIDINRNPFRAIEIEVIEREVVPGGIRLRLRVKHDAPPDRWRGGTIIFTCDDQPAATVQIVATTGST